MDQNDETGRVVRGWLNGDPEGRRLLDRLEDTPQAEVPLLRTWMERNQGSAPPVVQQQITGGHIDKLVIVAQAENVNLGQHADRIAADPYRPRLAPLLRRHEFVAGREKEMGLVRDVIQTRSRPYVFVTGMSGYGKTALLVELVRQFEASNGAGPTVVSTFISRVFGLADETFGLGNLCQQLAAAHDDRRALVSGSADLRARYLGLLAKQPPAGRRLVIVIDGLDEADGWIAPDLFPPDLPEQVVVVFSAREAAEHDWVQELQLPAEAVSQVSLTRFGRAEIREIVAAAGGADAAWASEPPALDAITTVSEGDPFYVRHLVDDIRERRILSVEALRKKPTGLKAYFDEWWKDVVTVVGVPGVADLLGYLLVARGPLTRDDLTDISEDDALAWDSVDTALDGVRRLLIGDADDGYTLCHSRFATYSRTIASTQRRDGSTATA
ncbi:ATP-binding protein [Solirubrobacter ginsenosidimutans]|uniref:ATP-binding protein n=1 Tax=Solirubrobacter ginsenosidimutans TaxID=490573 RepID=A0A9X3S370_9ACTN|nr:ATP-binding protein [Solirubrobacter ginsenosidimutans]MDA0165405.1 ATP-binding protein [Solirubrobacter ginsenosidimutans]